MTGSSGELKCYALIANLRNPTMLISSWPDCPAHSLLVSSLKSFGINQEYQRGVLFRLGRLAQTKGPGGIGCSCSSTGWSGSTCAPSPISSTPRKRLPATASR